MSFPQHSLLTVSKTRWVQSTPLPPLLPSYLKIASSVTEESGLFVGILLLLLIPFKPFSKSPISGELPHPLYFTRTVCSQVSFKYQISDISGIFNPEERLWVGLGKQVAFSLFSSWLVGFLCSVVLKDLFSFHLSREAWTFFSTQTLPYSLHSFKRC